MDLTDLLLLQKEKQLYLTFADGKKVRFSCEYLRVFSPSAEVKGHDGTLNWPKDKAEVTIDAIEPIGNYALKFHFSDGHQSGIYTFEYLYELMQNQEANWQRYQNALQGNS